MNPIVIRWLRRVVLGIGALVLMFSFALACTYVYLAPSLPDAETMSSKSLAVPLRVYSRSGGLISQIGEERRIPVDFDDLPMQVWQAVLAAEDDRFFQHSGLDWMGVTRAVFKTATGGSSQGGSTISQQAARNMFLTLDKTMRRKLSEIFLTWRMERDFSKEQILATYLNVIFFGQRSYGIAAAAETYFGKRLDELSVAQAATLAGIIQLPAIQNPIRSPKNAEVRRAYVLRRMTELGFIDSATAEAALKEPIASRGFAPLIDVEAPYVAEIARQELVKRFGEGAVNAGYKVFTTLDDRLQSAANRALRLGLIDFDRTRGFRGPLGKVELAAAANDEQFEESLSEYRASAFLQPAVVTQVADTSAEIYVKARGEARIPWEGMSWAAKAGKPRKATEILKRGDVIHVVMDGRGTAQLAQVPKAQAALVALDPVDGAVVSLVGGFDFYVNQFNRATQAKRQPGSGFKPFLYSAALEHGFTASTVIQDMPVIVDNMNSEENWRPKNSDGQFAGPMRMREALVRSKNPVSIRILQEVGWEAFIEHAGKFGFDTRDYPRNLTLALGSQSTTPLQMAAGFATFANGGFHVEPYFISRIEDSAGKVVFQAAPLIACGECERNPAAPATAGDPAVPGAEGEGGAFGAAVTAGNAADSSNVVPVTAGELAERGAPPPDSLDGLAVAQQPLPPPPRGLDDVPASMRDLAAVQGGRGFLSQDRLAKRAISPQNAWLMGDIMHDVTMRGTARRTRALNRTDLAGKTGTSDEGRDNWFNGYNGNIIATVWVGHDDYKPLGAGAEGSTTAVPIWMFFMREALRGMPMSRMPRPTGLIDLRVNADTGARTSPLDPNAVVEIFMLNHLPQDSGSEDLFNVPGGPPGSGAPLF